MIAVNKKGSKLTVEGINMQTKHVKPMKGARPSLGLGLGLAYHVKPMKGARP